MAGAPERRPPSGGTFSSSGTLRAPRLGKLWAFAACWRADLAERSGSSLAGLGRFHRDSPYFPARSGAVQCSRLWSLARGRLPGVPALQGMVASLACLGAARRLVRDLTDGWASSMAKQ